MEVEHKDDSSNTLANGSANSGKRGRGRPRGSVKKKVISMKEVPHNARASKRVDFFSPETVIRPKVKKRGRPKKIRIPGRPRKIPLTPEEEAERILRLSKKRKLSKPLGRPRIHPLVDRPKEKRGRGRPRKYESMASQNGRVDGNLKSLKITEAGGDTPRGRGRPRGSFKKKRGRPAGPSLVKRPTEGTPGKRGRPPGSGTKLQVRQDANGTPRKRGRPPGSGRKLKVISGEVNGTPKKRGRPPGSGTKVKVVKQVTDGIPRKRGRPPGSGTKVKDLLWEKNGSPRKRGRPLGSGKIKTVTEEAEHILTNSVHSVDAQPRKRGRPKKTEAFPDLQAEEVKSKENDEPSPKRPRSSFASSKSSSKPDADDQKASENDGCHVAAVENPVLSAGGAAKPDNIEQGAEDELNDASVDSRKVSSSRVAGKSQKKK
ncbi:chromosomal protein D1 [Hemibagrus wyckioides]|uniref:chromosomal protein D1 n=1 Tax=Hemibagrus wyckioides TaxID=337641 RepID=UPI00266D404B|nr:chromosomal protein D1 [Hemibagrus wyckioides]XP_058260940.1 chromosomal protein D1 [Hemibagrus wyckioides]XP_058260941.1 chromosomal protein D1 [Hemibagrus wyckioides]